MIFKLVLSSTLLLYFLWIEIKQFKQAGAGLDFFLDFMKILDSVQMFLNFMIIGMFI
jgi:hypothetical protein